VGEAEVSYRVIWSDDALSELNAIWETSADSEGVKNTATRVNIELEFVPLEAGESRDENVRVLIKHPLVVWFRVIERLAEVQVLHVHATRR
jgi:plasmid stabilization system protein ParE